VIVAPTEEYSRRSPSVVQTAVVFLVLVFSIATGGVREAFSVRQIISERSWPASGSLPSWTTGTSRFRPVRTERGAEQHAECISDSDCVFLFFPPDKLDDLPTR
jgi:hypothetical protein